MNFLLRNGVVATLCAAGLRALPAQEAYVEPYPEPHFTSLAFYLVSVPTGDTRRFASEPSWLGISMEAQWRFQRHAAAGIAIGVSDFSHRSNGTTNFSSGSATGEQLRDLVAVTVAGTTRWYFGPRPGRGTYLGVATGFLIAQQTYQLGVMPQFVRSALHLAVTPEMGVAIPVFDGVDAVVSARYTLPSRAGDYLGGGARRFQFLTIGVGLAEH